MFIITVNALPLIKVYFAWRNISNVMLLLNRVCIEQRLMLWHSSNVKTSLKTNKTTKIVLKFVGHNERRYWIKDRKRNPEVR
jgi:hypothetical protein